MAISDQQRIGERYELRQTIGIGGMARVYLAHDHLLNRDVAVKILNPALAADPAFVERFRREAQAAAALNHPNIVQIFDSGATDDTYYIVMEYVPGPNLKEIVRERGPLAEDDALAIGAQIAAALDAAHQHGLIHRDIKPHNVLRGPDGVAKVTDFGIARAAGASHLTATQAVMGTAQYISPEQALHRPLDGRSDLYSLGIVLYELLAGHPPFSGDSPVAVAMQQVHDPPPPLRTVRPDLSGATVAVVMRALAKDPAARFQTAGEMRAALLDARQRLHAAREATSALPLPPPPPPVTRTFVQDRYVPEPPVAPVRRSRAPWLLLGLLPLLLLVGIVGFLLTRGRGGATATATPPPTVLAAGLPATATAAPTATRTPAPSATAALAPTAAPTATAAPSPTAIPATPTPLATATATAAPTQPAPTATPAPPSPTAAPQSPAIANGSPQDAVRSFYALAAAHNYDAAARLWSDRQKAAYPPGEYINGRFDATQSIAVTIGNVQVNAGEGRATVDVDIVETRSDGVRHYVGAWQCVRTPSGWLLDNPNLSQV